MIVNVACNIDKLIEMFGFFRSIKLIFVGEQHNFLQWDLLFLYKSYDTIVDGITQYLFLKKPYIHIAKASGFTV